MTDDAAFFATATEAVNRLERELRRVPSLQSSSWRALELGSGSGRLLRAMSGHFAEIIGCESGEARIEASRHLLRDLSNAFIHPADGTRIPAVGDHSIDFVYSVGDFTERNGRAGALALFRELRRVLVANGLVCLRFTGQAPGAGDPVFTANELVEIAAAHDFQVFAMDGAGTRSLWTTWRKREEGWFQQTEAESRSVNASTVVRRITNASSNEAVAPCRGRFASILIYAENLLADASIGPLRVTIGTSLGIVTYIGATDRAGWQPIRVELPEQEETGLLPVQITWFDRPIAESVTLRVIPPGPMVPRVVAITDALRPGNRHKIVSGRMKLVMEEIAHPDEVQAFLGGKPAWDAEYNCLDPQQRRYQWSFQLPDEITPGTHTLEVRAAGRTLARVPVDVA
ncbi:MAG: class I SAM-dependent methyltransferase [Bryobacteraceae bacterium]